jgi:small subunit ribosomal protein S3
MSKVVHPYAHRLVTLRTWKSRWFADKSYQAYLKADVLIRDFLTKKMRGFYLSRIEIERDQKHTRIIIHTSRPGLIIGRNGEGMIKLKSSVAAFIKRHKLAIGNDFKLDVVEVDQPDADAAIVGYMVAEGIEKRLPFRRVLKSTIEKVMTARGVKGARIWITGRLGGTDIARSEEVKRGSIPLQTIRADIDYAKEKAHMPYGDLGIKVWIYRGEVFHEAKKPEAKR